MPTPPKKHKLTDGSYITVNELAEAVPLSITAARRRVQLSRDRGELFAKKFTHQNLSQNREESKKVEAKKKVVANTKHQLAYEKMIVETRSAYDSLWKLAMRGIGAGKTVVKGT